MTDVKRMITPTLERKAFEIIIRDVFSRYKDNLMCSEDTMENIIKDATQRIRKQLQGIKQTYIMKNG